MARTALGSETARPISARRIDALAVQRPLKTLAVTSANAGEGKSTCAVNLASVTAMSVGRSVLLVDCDLRRPKIHWTLGLQPQAGLAEVLMNQATVDEAIMKLIAGKVKEVMKS